MTNARQAWIKLCRLLQAKGVAVESRPDEHDWTGVDQAWEDILDEIREYGLACSEDTREAMRRER